MALTALLASLSTILLLPYLTSALSFCEGPCNTLNDCHVGLFCINGECNDPPELGTHICSNSNTSSGSGGGCSPAGTVHCGGRTYITYTCSPPVANSTPAKLTNRDFSKGGGDGGYRSACDGHHYSNSEPIVALSTGWYAGGSRCGKMIQATAYNGKTTTAKVVDECDSVHGCDKEHDGQPPCLNNIVAASDAVWNDLGLNKEEGMVDVTWAMAYIV